MPWLTSHLPKVQSGAFRKVLITWGLGLTDNGRGFGLGSGFGVCGAGFRVLGVGFAHHVLAAWKLGAVGFIVAGGDRVKSKSSCKSVPLRT